MRTFKIGLTVRVIILFMLMSCLSWMITNTSWVLTPVAVSIFTVLLLLEVMRYVMYTNRKVARFVKSLEDADFSVKHDVDYKDKSFSDLNKAFQNSVAQLSDLKLQQKHEFELLQLMVKEMQLGVLLVLNGKEILVMNTAFTEITQLPELKFVEHFECFIPEFWKSLKDVTVGGYKELKIEGDNPKEVFLKKSSFVLKSDQVELFTIEDFTSRNSEKEMDSWLRLIRILTHEIMNSVTSISSLASTASLIAEEESAGETLQKALSTIGKRSTGLLYFVEDYRKMMQIPAPQKTWFLIGNIVHEQCEILQDKLNGIRVETNGEQSLQVFADETQFEQVLINLMLNAIDALKEEKNPTISINWFSNGNQVYVQVVDNGKGIPADLLKDIFVPFFSTRQEGNGIGLSLSRQIMSLHEGGLFVKSKDGEGATFTCRFPLD